MMHRTRTLAIAASALVAGVTVGGIQLTHAASEPTATSVVPVEPYRILDTRLGIGAPAAPLGAGQTIDVQIAGVGPVPEDAVGVVLNITGTRTTEATYITAWPTGGVQPTASVLNLTPGIDAPNGVTALLGDGQLSLFNFTGSTDLIADVAGYLVGAAAPQPASVLSGREVVTIQAELAANASTTFAIAKCPEGKQVVGGGGFPTSTNLVMLGSQPTDDGAGWQAEFRSIPTVNFEQPFDVKAICVDVAP